MQSVEVFFATNRRPDPHVAGGFGDALVAGGSPELVTYGVAGVSGIDLANSGSGRIDRLDNIAMGGFDQATRDRLTADPHDLLVFIHGYANAFADAITRAAFVKTWFAAPAGSPERTVLAFSWPSNGAPAEYRSDQQRAAASGTPLAFFLRFASGVAKARRDRGNSTRMCLLAHSMGNHALQAAMTSWTGAGLSPNDPVFDEAIHAAADERSDTYEQGSSGMGIMRRVARRVSVYSSQADSAMHASFLANFNVRLGFDGPANKTDATLYEPAVFRSVDCTRARDFDFLAEPLASHQYYRRSPAVRADIAAMLAGQPPVAPGLSEILTVNG